MATTLSATHGVAATGDPYAAARYSPVGASDALKGRDDTNAFRRIPQISRMKGAETLGVEGEYAPVSRWS
jgi:hypothetical protein